jgi:hypothetical protein
VADRCPSHPQFVEEAFKRLRPVRCCPNKDMGNVPDDARKPRSRLIE